MTFYFGRPDSSAQIHDSNTYVRSWTYLGTVERTDEEGRACFRQKNKFCVGDTVEIMKKDFRNVSSLVRGIRNGEGEDMESAPHPLEKLHVLMDPAPEPGDLIRMETKE